MAGPDRTMIWPHFVKNPLADDGRPDDGIFIRRDIVRDLLIGRSAVIASDPPPTLLQRIAARVAKVVR